MNLPVHFDAVVAAENGLGCSSKVIECSVNVCTGFERRRTAGCSADCSGWAIVELGAPVPDLGTAGSDAAAWRMNVSCWSVWINAESCEVDLPFGK